MHILAEEISVTMSENNENMTETSKTVDDKKKHILEMVHEVMEVASEKKAENVIALHVAPYLHVVDYFVLATATNDRQMNAIVDDIQRQLRKKFGVKPVSLEGRRDSNWILLDYIDFVVHVFNADSRNEYRLESLWGNAEVLKPPSPEEAK